MHEVLKSNKTILVEGANAMLLDIDFGKDTQQLSCSFRARGECMWRPGLTLSVLEKERVLVHVDEYKFCENVVNDKEVGEREHNPLPRNSLLGCWWHIGSAHVSHHCDWGSIPVPCSYLIEVTLVTYEKSIVYFDSTKHRRFSPGTQVSSCSNTGPMRGGPCWTSRENSLAN